MTRTSCKQRFMLLAMGGIPLITAATCDPYTGVFDFYRDDDAGLYFDDYYYDDHYVYDDCFFFECF